MSAQAAIPLLCVLLTVFGVAIFWLITKLLSVRKALAAEKLAHGCFVIRENHDGRFLLHSKVRNAWWVDMLLAYRLYN
jgi:hypothetical protein